VARATLGVGIVARVDDDTVRAWVSRSCHEQGLPLTVTDARIVEQVRVLLTGQAKPGSGSRAERRTADRARQRERQPGHTNQGPAITSGEAGAQGAA
jgi:hypothetical protein